MANVTINVDDDKEVTIPKICKVSTKYRRKQYIYCMYRVLRKVGEYHKILCVSPSVRFSDIYMSTSFEIQDFENAVEMTKEEWNAEIRKAANEFVDKNVIK